MLKNNINVDDYETIEYIDDYELTNNRIKYIEDNVII